MFFRAIAGFHHYGWRLWIGRLGRIDAILSAYGYSVTTQDDFLKLAPLITLAFGLIHGFGFAGLLSDIGLPPDNVVSALIGFNIGIEIGQLLVFVPLVVLGPYLLEELPTPPIKWADIAALVLTVFRSFYLFRAALSEPYRHWFETNAWPVAFRRRGQRVLIDQLTV